MEAGVQTSEKPTFWQSRSLRCPKTGHDVQCQKKPLVPFFFVALGLSTRDIKSAGNIGCVYRTHLLHLSTVGFAGGLSLTRISLHVVPR